MKKELYRFDAATNPYGPSPSVREALAAYAHTGDYCHYGEERAESLREDLAGHWGLTPEHFIVYNGAGEAVLWLFLAKLLLERGKLIVPTPSYERFVAAGRRCSMDVLEVPLDSSDFSFSPERFIAAGKATGARVLLLSSPNNPTGNALLDEMGLAALLDALPDCLCIVDEAYADYADQSFMPLIAGRTNLVVLRTFSKAYGLAGLRIGYAAASRRTIASLAKMQIPWAVNSMSLVAARAALADRQYLSETVHQIRRDSQAFYNGLNDRSWLTAYPSDANFNLVRFTGISATELQTELAKGGVRARWRQDMPDCLRLTALKPADNEYLLALLDGIAEEAEIISV